MMSKKTNLFIAVFVSVLIVIGFFIIFGDGISFFEMGRGRIEKVLKESKLKRVPVIFFAYSNREEKRGWRGLVAQNEVVGALDDFLSVIVPASLLDIFSVDGMGVLFVDFKGKKRFFEKRFLSSDEFLVFLTKMWDINQKMLKREHIAKKESIKINKIFREQKYLSAMRQCRKFLAVYSNTETAGAIRNLLDKCADKPQVKKHLDENRDIANRKLLLHSAQEANEYKEYYKFLRIVSMLEQKYPGTEEAKEAKKLKAEMEKDSRRKFKEANEFYMKKKFARAMEAYEAMHRNYKGTHWDLFISGKIQQLTADPQYQKYLKQVDIDYEAKVLFKQAEKHFKNKRYNLALKFYHEIVKLYSRSKYLIRAKQRIEEIQNIDSTVN